MYALAEMLTRILGGKVAARMPSLCTLPSASGGQKLIAKTLTPCYTAASWPVLRELGRGL